MAPMTERVIEDGSWLLLLIAVIAFFWFHQRDKRQASRSDEEVKVPKKAA
jgi:hypothetical protein